MQPETDVYEKSPTSILDLKDWAEAFAARVGEAVAPVRVEPSFSHHSGWGLKWRLESGAEHGTNLTLIHEGAVYRARDEGIPDIAEFIRAWVKGPARRFSTAPAP